MIRPSINHSLLSPSGHISKRARNAALACEAAILFPPGYWDLLESTEQDIRAVEALSLRRAAADLRSLASRGMSPRKFNRAAETLEAEAALIER